MPGPRKILSIDDLSNGDLSRLFFAASNNIVLSHTNKICNIMLAFFEPSTRTRLSFQMAAHHIGAKVLTFDPRDSSLKKGESEEDTLKTLAALGPDLLVIRQDKLLDPKFMAELGVNIINAGDGQNEHPTQALLDCFTLLKRFGTSDLSGQKILICGDIARSRVFRSNLKLMNRLGAKISLIVPKILGQVAPLGVDYVYDSFEEIREHFDVLMLLRVQEERMPSLGLFDRQQYFLDYGLNLKRFESLGPKCLLMHPGPTNIGVEIDKNLVDHQRSLILDQVKNGVLIRAAAMSALFDFGG